MWWNQKGQNRDHKELVEAKVCYPIDAMRDLSRLEGGDMGANPVQQPIQEGEIYEHHLRKWKQVP